MGEQKKILIVDDEESVLHLLEKILSSSGFQPQKALNGKEALAQLERDKPDCILLDIIMPVMNGMEACKAIRANVEYASIPIIMLTGQAEESNIVKCLEFGADDYLLKPFGNDHLLSKIDSLLEHVKKGTLPSQFAAKKSKN